MKDLVFPNYEHSILNLITSILKFYKVETEHKSLDKVDNILKNHYKNVIFIVLDGMGEHILKNISKDGFLRSKEMECVTSVYPSTTTAALTTYYSGRPPYETGWIAWSQYFKEYGRPIDMFSHRESLNGREIKKDKLSKYNEIVKYQNIFERIMEASPNINTYYICPSYSEKMGKYCLKADSVDEIVENIDMVCEKNDEKFIFAYCDNPDNILHKFGTKSQEVKDYLLSTEKKIEKMYKNLPEDSIVIISADHGHKDIEKAYTLLDYPEIMECLIIPPSLESRSLAFWVKEDMKKEFEKRFNEKFGNEFLLMTKQEFLEKNFLGFGKKHPKIDDFIGNYMALSISSSIIKLETFLEEAKPTKKSTHCGLTKEEMEVPVIILEK